MRLIEYLLMCMYAATQIGQDALYSSFQDALTNITQALQKCCNATLLVSLAQELNGLGNWFPLWAVCVIAAVTTTIIIVIIFCCFWQFRDKKIKQEG